jgi:hypothetical protein
MARSPVALLDQAVKLTATGLAGLFARPNNTGFSAARKSAFVVNFRAPPGIRGT